eukprot:TRINITY_DN10104_c0_g1_i1.p1 TRINITY_DN10104_c0_g1~~TRINITY_DN10104_c0_g1_i1.p1  ORF type:complete len:335 (+),score=50.74 TRINITY_DN10104_c0_g1_i1:44-1048(+)
MQNMSTIPGYDMVKKLAKGGQATVYKAVASRGTAERVAVKIFHGDAAQAACESELRVLTAVQGHRNVARLITGFGTDGGPCALVLEFYVQDLHKLALKRQLSEAKCVDVMRGVLSALAHVHSLDIVHRDVKPENVAIGRDGAARLLDFGVATSIHDEDNMRTFPGSPGYAAPELIGRKNYGFPVDIFALGATFYFVLCQEHAFATLDMKPESICVKTKKGVISFGEKFDDVSDATQDSIRWLMHKTAKWRPTAANALSSAPFAVSVKVQREGEPVSSASQEPPRLAIAPEVHAPTKARERPACPAARARLRWEADHETPQQSADPVAHVASDDK